MCFLNSAGLSGVFWCVYHENFAAKPSYGQLYLGDTHLFQHKHTCVPQKSEHLRKIDKFSLLDVFMNERFYCI